MSFDSFLTMAGDVYAKIDGRAASGGMMRTTAATPKAKGQACRVQDDGAGQVVIAEGKSEVVTHTIFTLYLGTVTGDEWRVNGVTYRYLGTRTRTGIGNIPTFKVLLVQEVKN